MRSVKFYSSNRPIRLGVSKKISPSPELGLKSAKAG